METRFSPDATYIDGSVFDMNLLTFNDNELINATQDAGNEKKSPKTMKNANPDGKRTSKTKLSQNDDLDSTKVETKKAGRTSNTKREPLKVLNTRDTAGGAPTKKNEAKNNSKRDSTQGRTVEKGTPKVVIFPNDPRKSKVQSRKKKSTNLGTDATSGAMPQRSLREGKTQNSRLSLARKARYSLDDISRAKAQSKTKTPPKSAEESVKSPEFYEFFTKLETTVSNIDSDFIKSPLLKFKGSLTKTTENLNKKEKDNGLPTTDNYLRRQRVEEMQEVFMENFTVQDFLLMFPNPWKHFSNKEREKSSSYLKSSLHYLKNKYKKHYAQAIQKALEENQNSLYLADKELSRKNRLLKLRATSRTKFECDACRPTTFDVQFMYEVAFIENEKKIKSYLKKAVTGRHEKFKETEKAETPLECLSCSKLGLLQDDTVNCPAHHVFCRDCLIKYVKIEMGDNDFKFKCLLKCEEAFSVQSLQGVLSPPVLGSIIQRNQTGEFKPEGIENLVCCPFCCKIFMVPTETRDIMCINPACLLVFCRKCKKTSHVPWNCNEAQMLAAAPLEVKEEEEGEAVQPENGENEDNEKENEADLSLTL